MKKILFTLLLVVGGFVAQAQDTITARYFTQDGATYVVAYAESDNEQCVEATTQQVYTYDSNTGILSIDGAPGQALTGAAKTYYDSVFAASSLFVLPANNNGIPTAGPIQNVTFN